MFRKIGSLLALAALLLSPALASAHAIVNARESTPLAGSTVSGPDVGVDLHFNSKIDSARSVLTLFGPLTADSKPDDSGIALKIDTAAPEDRLEAKAQNLTPGSYRLHWQVLATDGHLTRGDIPFTVAVAPPANAGVPNQPSK